MQRGKRLSLCSIRCDAQARLSLRCDNYRHQQHTRQRAAIIVANSARHAGIAIIRHYRIVASIATVNAISVDIAIATRSLHAAASSP